ncbi:SDR family NAD(P)-dependent oxidoreductase [Mucilaginibacter pedocola]|uniref:Short-chain dehydrogenase n=1 Tax=Mucilaginibacter pedocola TaxID=1792845 RepID=A0A1S9PA95_9SPHI|nr:SDR family oxidoreductase [Mucilaginibacter pedocola]OOQ57851.1 hypothetical protein BC343_13825 [Mucilaginibacter pedocola]
MKVLITGGSSGIGKGLAENFHEKGWDVLVTGRDVNKLAQLANDLQGIRTLVYDSSVADDEIKIVEFIRNVWENKLDILVNNAGHVALTPFGNLKRETLENMYRVHLTAPSLLTAGCLDALKNNKGQILNITSSHGIKPYAQLMAYGSAKSGLNMLTKIWALELAPFGIRVNAIAPGPTDTPVLTNSGFSAADIKNIQDTEQNAIPLKRRGEVSDIVNIAAALAGGAAWLTGAIIPVDGGISVS